MSSIVAWTDHKAFVLHGLRQLYATGRLSDLEIKCHDQSFKVHKLILGLFTDYFNECDGLWMRINVNVSHMESILNFFYHGQVVINYDQMEGFLSTCKFLRVKLFKGASFNAEGMSEEESDLYFQERYELSDFQLMCTGCYKCFPDDKSLKKHTWACLRPKNFRCRFCEKGFRHKNDIANHERQHTGERPFTCTRGSCGRTFTLRSGMNKHIRKDHDRIPYPCGTPHCDKQFDTEIQRRYHKATVHAADKPWACMECGRCFALNDLLKQHMVISHAPKGVKERRNRLLNERYRQKMKQRRKLEEEQAEEKENTVEGLEIRTELE